MGRSKYNVGKDVEKRTYNGIIFDSAMEMKFYRDVVLPQAESGLISHYELQKPYELQPKFIHDEKKINPIVYVADFYIEYNDGKKEIIDTKGAADSVAKMKRKMMWYQYPDTPYKWLTFVKKMGGWVDYEDVAKMRREAKRMKKKEESQNEQDE